MTEITRSAVHHSQGDRADAAQIRSCANYILGQVLNQDCLKTNKADALCAGLFPQSFYVTSLPFHYRLEAAQSVVNVLAHLLVDIYCEQKQVERAGDGSGDRPFYL